MTDKISLLADDSAMLVSRLLDQVEAGRRVIDEYEMATGGKLHDTKIKIMKIGATKNDDIGQKELKVEYEIMKNEENDI